MNLYPFCYTPSSFIDFMREKHTSLNQFSWEFCFIYLSLVWGNVGANKRFKHSSKPECFAIPAKLLRERLGKDYKYKLKVIGLIEIAGNHNQVKGETRPYFLTSSVRKLVMQYMNCSHEPTDILGINSKPYPLRTNNYSANAIKSRDKNDNTKKSKACINPIVKIDIEALESIKTALIQHRDLAFHSIEPIVVSDTFIEIKSIIVDLPKCNLGAWLERRLISTMQLIHMATTNVRLPSGNLIQFYIESGSGRLYGQDIHLQSVPREVRQAALAGQFDYDFENCHYAILHQLAANYETQTPYIAEYLSNKQEVRTRLSAHIGVSASTVKECLIALIYGASIKEGPNLALTEILGPQKLGELRKNKLFTGIHREIKQTAKTLLNPLNKNSQLVNVMNKKFLDKSANKLAHILQGYEAKMLNIAMDMHSDSITLLQHDGFTSTNPNIDLAELQAEIINQTGLNMTISKESLKNLGMHSIKNTESFAA